MIFNVTLVGTTEILARLGDMPAALRAGLIKKIKTLILRLEAKVKGKLDFQVLRRITTDLYASIHETGVREEGDHIWGAVHSDGSVKYARIHEYGFDGDEAVRAHTRLISMVFGRPVDPIQVEVGAHTRHMHMPMRSFLRSSLHEMEAEISRGLKEALVAAMMREQGA